MSRDSKNFDSSEKRDKDIISEVEKKVSEIEIPKSELANKIDHTLLSQTVGESDIEALCREAIDHQFHSVCVSPAHVETCADILQDSDVKVDVVIGFPLGQTTPEAKKFEALDALDNGADEVDMVANIGAIKDRSYEYVEREVSMIVDEAEDELVKVILETGHLSDEEIVQSSRRVEKAGADFLKNSTGFGPEGANVPDISLLSDSTGLKVKASGGIRTFDDALRMIIAGADRIGSSSGVEIMETFSD